MKEKYTLLQHHALMIYMDNNGSPGITVSGGHPELIGPEMYIRFQYTVL